MHRVHVIDSHTEGEPTRVVVSGGPDLGDGPLPIRARVFRDRFDRFRSAVVNEPRGSDVLVGALLVPPDDPRHACGVIFFNNVGPLHACGHGTIGLAETLAHLGRVGTGRFVVETPVGPVAVERRGDGTVSIDNVPSYRHATGVAVDAEFDGAQRRVIGDVAWGGNWFFLTDAPRGEPLDRSNIDRLTAFAWAIRRGLEADGITGAAGGVIDHVELFGPPSRADCDGKNFVLCPGKAYDRSPCGTGTSAKMACLLAGGTLRPGQPWRQESIIGSRFVGSIREEAGRLVPTITGSAYITAEATLLLDDRDPFRDGIRPD